MDNNFEHQTSENVADSNVNAEQNQNPVSGMNEENRYTDPNAGVEYKETTKTQEEASETVSYTYGAPHTDQEQHNQDNPNLGAANQQNTSYSYGNPGNINGGYSNNYNNVNYNAGNNGYGYNAGYQNMAGQQPTGMDESPLSMGEWLLTMLVSVVPCVGLIFYFFWAFEKGGNVNRRNYCRAALIMQLVGIVICVLFFAFILVAGFSSYYYY